MIIIILYQNDEELNTIQEYIKNYINNYTFIGSNNNFIQDNKIIYFKSYIYNNISVRKNNNIAEYKYIDIYKKIYTKELNQRQLNHLLSIKKILELSIGENYESIMILEYDVYFHKNFNELIKKYDFLIKNNSIIHLGSSQHKWYDIITGENINIKQWKDIKYYNNSHSLGTFAIILKKDIFMEYLNFINYVLIDYKYFPSDVILSIISRNYKSIVLYPNIVICNLDKSTIIEKDRSDDYIKFKWFKNNYVI
jgi:hypothetical protein